MKFRKTTLALIMVSEIGGCRMASSPSIVTQPSNETVIAGQTAIFIVKAEGKAPLQYQWYRNGQLVRGANSSIYTLPTTTSADDGATFQVSIKNSIGAVNSKEAILAINTKANSYSRAFTSTENPISDGGKWVGGQSAGGNLWGDIQSNGTMAFGVSEPTEFGDPTAVLAGRWSASQKVTATVRINTV